MRVTFDSNIWEQIVHPEGNPKNIVRREQLISINRAIAEGHITAFVCDVVATLEALKRSFRAEFLSKQGVVPKIHDMRLSNGETRKIVVAGPDQSHRPPLKPILTDRITEGFNLGIRFIRVPRYNDFAFPSEYYAAEPADYVELWGKAESAIFKRGVGKALLREVSFKLGHKIQGGQAYFDIPDVPMTDDDKTEVANAVGEWADGDSVASHIAFRNDIFCSEDKGGKHGNRKSVCNRCNREWLAEEYSVVFAGLSDLANQFLS